MGKILSIVSIQDGKVKRAALEVLSRCRTLAEETGHTLCAALLTETPEAFIEEVQTYGAAHIYTVAHPALAQHRNAPLLAALKQVIEEVQPGLVAMASTEATKDILGALAVRVDAAVLSDVASVTYTEGHAEAMRPVMAAKFLAHTEARGPRILVSVRSGAYDATTAPVEATVHPVTFSFTAPVSAAHLREVLGAVGDTVDLSEASVVVAGGRGVKDEAGRAMLEELAGLFNGAIGASRAVVESGLFPATAQIGQTGKVVSPELYFAIGISGAIQHVAGMANSKVIVAINKDGEAPIFQYATYGIVGDLYKILPPLIDGLRAAKGQ